MHLLLLYSDCGSSELWVQKRRRLRRVSNGIVRRGFPQFVGLLLLHVIQMRHLVEYSCAARFRFIDKYATANRLVAVTFFALILCLFNKVLQNTLSLDWTKSYRIISNSPYELWLRIKIIRIISERWISAVLNGFFTCSVSFYFFLTAELLKLVKTGFTAHNLRD